MLKQRGFTLIELIIVIVILGILSVTAMPRFIDLSGDAIRATAKAEAAAFQASIDLIHGTYAVRETNPVVVQGASVYIDTTSEWPTGSGSGSQLCINLWNSVLAKAEPIVEMTSLTSLPAGWSTIGNVSICLYGKSSGSEAFQTGDLPHFVYYIRDVGDFTLYGQAYGGSAGYVQKVNM